MAYKMTNKTQAVVRYNGKEILPGESFIATNKVESTYFDAEKIAEEQKRKNSDKKQEVK